ncbi:MAG: acyl carrier protein [Pusillimonas sp.]|jgi:acyl carrier protein|nr:acyl carrier protein [Pusillimonas sp.]|tara:strand:+ start:75 stop:323 length:249 start_codon:yes stop_codon:yes gene_type:complete
MDSQTIEKRVKELLSEHLCIHESEINVESRLFEDLGADSLDFVELAIAIEDELETEIPDKDFEAITTVQQIIDLVAKYRFTD